MSIDIKTFLDDVKAEFGNPEIDEALIRGSSDDVIIILEDGSRRYLKWKIFELLIQGIYIRGSKPHRIQAEPNFLNTKINPFCNSGAYPLLSEELRKLRWELYDGTESEEWLHSTEEGNFRIWSKINITASAWYIYLRINSFGTLPIPLPGYDEMDLCLFNDIDEETSGFLEISFKITFVIEDREELVYINHTERDKGDYIEFAIMKSPQSEFRIELLNEFVFTRISFCEAIRENTSASIEAIVTPQFKDLFNLDVYLLFKNDDNPLEEDTPNPDILDTRSEPSNFIIGHHLDEKIRSGVKDLYDYFEAEYTSICDCTTIQEYMSLTDYRNAFMIIHWTWVFLGMDRDLDETPAPMIAGFLNTTIALFFRIEVHIKLRLMFKPYMGLDRESFISAMKSMTFFEKSILPCFFGLTALRNFIEENPNGRLIDYNEDTSGKITPTMLTRGLNIKIEANGTKYIFENLCYVKCEEVKGAKHGWQRSFRSIHVLGHKNQESKFIIATGHGCHNLILGSFGDPNPMIYTMAVIKSFINPGDIFSSKAESLLLINDLPNHLHLFSCYDTAFHIRNLREIISLIRAAKSIDWGAIIEREKTRLSDCINKIMSFDEEQLAAALLFLRGSSKRTLNFTTNKILTKRLMGIIVLDICKRGDSEVINVLYALNGINEGFKSPLRTHIEKIKNSIFKFLKVDLSESIDIQLNLLIECTDERLLEIIKTLEENIEIAEFEPPDFSTVNFRLFFNSTIEMVKNSGVWSDKMITWNNKEKFIAWGKRFNRRIITSRLFQNIHLNGLQDIMNTIYYFSIITNYDYIDTYRLMLFTTGAVYPGNFEKVWVSIVGASNSGKSTFMSQLASLLLISPMNFGDDKITEVDGSEAQIRYREEADIIDGNFLKKNADVEVRETGRRHYVSSLPTLSIGKPISISNKHPIIKGSDTATYNRIEPFYLRHSFTDIKFSGSLYYHYKIKSYPVMNDVNSSFLAHLPIGLGHFQKYLADPGDMRVKFRYIGRDDEVVKNNKRTVAARNNLGYALAYVISPTTKVGEFTSDEVISNLASTAIPHIKNWFEFPKGEKRELKPIDLTREFNNIYLDKYSNNRGGYLNMKVSSILTFEAPQIRDHDSEYYKCPKKRRRFK